MFSFLYLHLSSLESILNIMEKVDTVSKLYVRTLSHSHRNFSILSHLSQTICRETTEEASDLSRGKWSHIWACIINNLSDWFGDVDSAWISLVPLVCVRFLSNKHSVWLHETSWIEWCLNSLFNGISIFFDRLANFWVLGGTSDLIKDFNFVILVEASCLSHLLESICDLHMMRLQLEFVTDFCVKNDTSLFVWSTLKTIILWVLIVKVPLYCQNLTCNGIAITVVICLVSFINNSIDRNLIVSQISPELVVV